MAVHRGGESGSLVPREVSRGVGPEARYILAHAIGVGPGPEFVPWAGMFLDTLKGLFPAYPDNFYVEIRDFQSPALKRTLDEVPVTRIL